MIPPTTTGMSAPSARNSSTTRGTSSRGEPDLLVDDLHTDVAGTDGDLLGAVRVPVQAGLADQDADRVSDLLGDLGDALADPGEEVAVDRTACRGLCDAGRGAVVAEDLAKSPSPLAGGRASLGGLQGRRQDVRALVAGHLSKTRQSCFYGPLISLGLPLLESGDPLSL